MTYLMVCVFTNVKSVRCAKKKANIAEKQILKVKVRFVVLFVSLHVHRLLPSAIIFLEEPKCLQGSALRTTSGRFWKCASAHSQHKGISLADAEIVTPCPLNYECHFDGQHFGCCPSKSL